MKSLLSLLSIGLIVLLVSCGGSGSVPSRLSQIPADLNNPKLEAAGIYQDGWIGETGSTNLTQPPGDQVLTFRAMVPNLGKADFRTTAELRLDGRPLDSKLVSPGDFEISAPVPAGAGLHRLTLAFSPVQQLPGGDSRMVGGRLQFLGFEPLRRAGAAVEIVRGTGLELGGGWGVLETFKGETFRWVDNDAHVRVTVPHAGDAALALAVEPGPGVGGPFLLKALDESGRQVSAVKVERRGTVKLFLPVEPEKPAEFRLHVDGGGKPAKNETRVLNFRVFQAEVQPPSAK